MTMRSLAIASALALSVTALGMPFAAGAEPAHLYGPAPAISSGQLASHPGAVDTLASDPGHATIVRLFPPSSGGTTAGSDNAWGTSLQGVYPATWSPAAYERALLILQYEHRDPSSYGVGAVTRDGVDLELQGRCVTTSGRCWNLDTILTFPPATDGYGVFVEGSLANYAPDHADPNDTQYGKFGVNLNASGPTPGTAALAIRGTGGSWHVGLFADPASLAPGGALISSQAFGVQMDFSLAGGILGRIPPNLPLLTRVNGQDRDALYNNGWGIVVGGLGDSDSWLWAGDHYVSLRAVAARLGL